MGYGYCFWCLMPLSTIFQYIMAVSFIGGGNPGYLEKTLKLFIFALSSLCFQFLWIVHFLLLLLYSLNIYSHGLSFCIIVDHVDCFFFSFFLQKSDVHYWDSKDEQQLSGILSYNERFLQPINDTVSTVHIPVEIFKGSELQVIH